MQFPPNPCSFIKDKPFLLILINRYVKILSTYAYGKICDDSLYTQIVMKKNLFFLSSIRMSGKNVNFGDKKIKKETFIKTKK